MRACPIPVSGSAGGRQGGMRLVTGRGEGRLVAGRGAAGIRLVQEPTVASAICRGSYLGCTDSPTTTGPAACRILRPALLLATRRWARSAATSSPRWAAPSPGHTFPCFSPGRAVPCLLGRYPVPMTLLASAARTGACGICDSSAQAAPPRH